MANLQDTLITSIHQNFQSPYPRPLLSKPMQPLMGTGIQLYETRPDPDDCRCDAHRFQSNMSR